MALCWLILLGERILNIGPSIVIDLKLMKLLHPRGFVFFSLLLTLALGMLPGQTDEGSVIFLKHVLPVLREKCGGCHGEDRKLSDLSLSSREGILKGGKRGPAVVPADAAGSLLISAIEQTGKLKMPPGNKLPDTDIAAVKRWIELGAPWAEGAAKTEPAWNYSAEDTWELQPLKHAAPPAGGNPIDAFIARKLQDKGIEPAPPADRVTLLRRATFDLTGLPPTGTEVSDFVKDPAPAPQAFRKVVDRLLASPRYGERWGRHWLDVVRYADTAGYSNDFERPNAWRYRDYVIRSFNRDKPYDQFVREQIAGDEMDAKDPEKLVATGFLRMGPWEHTAMSVAAETRQAWLDDVTHSTAATFLGLTMECARCHDHKFDPLPTKDYYRLQAVFATTEFADRPAPFLSAEKRADFESGRARLQAMSDRNRERLAGFERIVRERFAAKTGKSLADLPPEDVDKAVKTDKLLSPEEYERSKVFRKRADLYARSIKRYDALAFGVSDGPFEAKDKGTWSIPDVFILPVGNLKTPGEKVTPGLISAVMRYDPSATTDVTPAISGRRLALANWIASPANPLTARVMVNRIWQYHFGRGIAGTPNNLGKMGEKPTHPELLDWLASYFIEHGWSVKEMHRAIMLSAAYQRSSQPAGAEKLERADPDNKLLSRFPPRRLEAEEIRDTILSVSGELSADAGGPGTFPEINEGVANQPQQIMGTLMPAWHPSLTKRERNRRTVYSFQKRNLTDPFVDVFNGPSLDESTERRLASTVPTQVFSLFNGEFTHTMALAFAARLDKLGNPDAEIDAAFERSLSRLPSAEERVRVRKFLAAMTAYHRGTPPPPIRAPQPLVRGITSELTGTEVPIEEDRDPGRFEPNLQPSQTTPETRALAELTLALFNVNEFVYVY